MSKQSGEINKFKADRDGKSVPVKDMPSIANSIESQKSFKKTNRLIKTMLKP